MNSLFIVLPILTLLMFDLGLTLRPQDFLLVARRPKAVAVGLCGQLLILPLIALAISMAFDLPPYFFIGMMLIACSPGGSSSNIFSMIAKGDVALSVSLTALSSVITLVTVPVIMFLTTHYLGAATGVSMPMDNLLVQNLITMLLPIVAGIFVRMRWSGVAERMDRVLSKIAFPALMLLAGLFFVQHNETITANFATLGLCTALLIILSITFAYSGSRMCRLNGREQRTIVIEVGMQNAAQAISIASSPFVFDNSVMAVPAIIYALLMNVILLGYVAVIKRVRKTAESF